LIVHPAPRIIRAPVPNRAMYVRGTDGGALTAYEAMVMDQATGTRVVAWLSQRVERLDGRTARIE